VPSTARQSASASEPRTWTKARSQLANATKSHGANSPEAQQARQHLKALRLEEHVRRVIAQAPPLTDEQRTRLAELLAPIRRSGGSA
jgi:hypothetical protein